MVFPVRPAALVLVPLVLAAAGCDMSVHNLAGRATEEWIHTYPLSAGGVVKIGNTNGRIEVEGVDGSTVEVRAEKIARAATESGARELLTRITIKEDISPDRVAVETEKWSGITLGAGFEVRYKVRVPKNAAIDITTSNGGIGLNGLTGKVTARTTNGGVTGKALGGAVEARSTNGGVSVDMASIGEAPVSLRTTNGGVTLGVPDGAKADLSAKWTNGGITMSPGLKVEMTESSRRSFTGKINGGGALIELQSTNGGIRLRPQQTGTTETKAAEKSPAEGEVLKERNPR